MISELIRAFLLIFAAELGDKTQIIAMTFATQYKVQEVLAGVFMGVFLNHGLAIVLGRYISKLIPINLIQIVAGIMFVIFGLLALREEELDEKGSRKAFSPILTVALAFFIGELGDKTQLTAMTLSAEGNYPFFILLGTTLGMLGTSGLGIYVGSKIGKKVPDLLIKTISSMVFLFFGTLKLYEWVPKGLLSINNIRLYFIIILSVYLLLMGRLIIKRKSKSITPMKEVADILYKQAKELNEAIEDICLGEGRCGKCCEDQCIIGYTKQMLENATKSGQYYVGQDIDYNDLAIKNFDVDKVVEVLSLIIVDYIEYGVDKSQNFIINQARESLESILFNRKISFDGDIHRYIRSIKRIDYPIGRDLERKVNAKIKASI